MQVLILRPENIEYVARKTGRSREDLRREYLNALSQNKLVYISIGAPWS